MENKFPFVGNGLVSFAKYQYILFTCHVPKSWILSNVLLLACLLSRNRVKAKLNQTETKISFLRSSSIKGSITYIPMYVHFCSTHTSGFFLGGKENYWMHFFINTIKVISFEAFLLLWFGLKNLFRCAKSISGGIWVKITKIKEVDLSSERC